MSKAHPNFYKLERLSKTASLLASITVLDISERTQMEIHLFVRQIEEIVKSNKFINDIYSQKDLLKD